MARIAINGFGEIGRRTYLLSLDNPHTNVVAVNDLDSKEDLIHFLKYSSIFGRRADNAKLYGNILELNKKETKIYQEKEIEKLPWRNLDIDIVIESSGVNLTREKAKQHIKAGAKKVLLSAPYQGENYVKTVVYGVNHESLCTYDDVVSNASCTTNCAAVIAKIIHDNFGIKNGSITTIHSYTNDQNLTDSYHKDPRRRRAASLSMIPTTTGAARDVGLVIPDLEGKLEGLSIRVPTPNVSLLDLTLNLKTETDKEIVNEILKLASENELMGILGYSKELNVSIDYNDTIFSAIVDSELTKVIDKNTLKIIAWYDNTTGFSKRLIDVSNFISNKMGYDDGSEIDSGLEDFFPEDDFFPPVEEPKKEILEEDHSEDFF